MPKIHLPEPGRPQVLIEPAGERRSILDLDPSADRRLYKAHGALLLRGFGADVPQFRNFARQFCSTSVVNESPGRQPIEPDYNVHSVDAGRRAVQSPSRAVARALEARRGLLRLLSAPSRGGATTICDGVALVRECPKRCGAGWRAAAAPGQADLAGLLDSGSARSRPDRRAARQSAAKLVPLPVPPHRRELVRFFSRPALHRPMFIDAPAFGNFLLFRAVHHNRLDYPLLDDGQTGARGPGWRRSGTRASA